MPIFSEGRVLPAPSRADRRIANASKGHCTGFSVLGEGSGVRVAAESWTEQRHLHLQDARHDVVDVREQVKFFYGRSGKLKHVFDMVATKSDGQRIAYTVKPEVDLESGRFIDHMQVVSWWVREKAFAKSVRLLTEADIDPTSLHNANIGLALRDVDVDAIAAARLAVGGLRGAVSVKNLTEVIGLEATGYRAVLKLIATGELVPLRHDRITPQTMVQPKEYAK